MSEIYEPQITILETPNEVEKYVADLVIEQVHQKPDSVLTLPTGGTPVGVYGLLVAAYKAGGVDFGQVTTINLDEYWPILKGHPASYASYMQEHFFSQVNVPEANQNIPNGEASDNKAEAERYEAVIKAHIIDLGLITLGPGETCHIGFNERGSKIDSLVRYVPLDEETKQANLRFFEDANDMPIGAITQGVADILAARCILFVATGEHKSWGVRRSLEGDISSDAPASFLRYHPDVHVILDQSAAKLLG
ncbi:MAG TPA: glucosamine-6-phosphate deaminase [Candidatus Saccharimonadales bacterium]|jgi:glucosamine-6-phosphate deaminase|nr:glucosamine-6-phosphate deaminase [Candidatus Saccharimonadales bacterium]